MEKISFEINGEEKNQLEEFCSATGISAESLARVLIKNVLTNKRMPFVIKQEDVVETVQKLDALTIIQHNDPVKLLGILEREPAFVGAVVLDKLSEGKAALVLQNLSEKKRNQVLRELCNGKISISLAKVVMDYVANEVENFSEDNFATIGGVEKITDIINLTDRAVEDEILKQLESINPEIYNEVKERTFCFDDIVYLDDRAIQKLLREVDTQELAKALKLCAAETAEKLYRNMSKNAATMLKEDMEFMGPVRKKDVYEAQDKIVSIIRRLEDCGEIVIVKGSDELV